MNNKERFIRWQGILRNQLTFLNSLLITISIGIIGFAFSLLKSPEFNPADTQKVFFTFGLILISISVICGLFTAFNRLLDFRATTKKIRLKDKDSTSEELSELEELIKKHGKTTWFLLYSQLITLCIGILNLIIAFLLIYKDKLFN